MKTTETKPFTQAEVEAVLKEKLGFAESDEVSFDWALNREPDEGFTITARRYLTTPDDG